MEPQDLDHERLVAAAQAAQASASQFQIVLNWSLGTLTVLLGWLSARLWSAVDALRKAHTDTQVAAAAAFVPRAEMQKHLDDLRVEVRMDLEAQMEAFLRLHAENLMNFGRVDTAFAKVDKSLERLHVRLDDVITSNGRREPRGDKHG